MLVREVLVQGSLVEAAVGALLTVELGNWRWPLRGRPGSFVHPPEKHHRDRVCHFTLPAVNGHPDAPVLGLVRALGCPVALLQLVGRGVAGVAAALLQGAVPSGGSPPVHPRTTPQVAPNLGCTGLGLPRHVVLIIFIF